jgi:hypothetical protein
VQRKIAEGEADVMLATLHPELWPALRISQPEPERWSRLGILRRGALSASAIHDVAARAAVPVLDLVERLRMRGIWRQLNAALMYYWYWRGVRTALGRREALNVLAERWRAARSSATIVDVDLRDGLEEAVERIDITRPDALRVWYGGVPVGTIPHLAGAERLRGEHLAPLVADTLPGPLLTAMAIWDLASADRCDAADEQSTAATAIRRAG